MLKPGQIEIPELTTPGGSDDNPCLSGITVDETRLHNAFVMGCRLLTKEEFNNRLEQARSIGRRYVKAMLQCLVDDSYVYTLIKEEWDRLDPSGKRTDDFLSKVGMAMNETLTRARLLELNPDWHHEYVCPFYTPGTSSSFSSRQP